MAEQLDRSWGDYAMTPPKAQEAPKNHERKQSCKSNSQNMWKAFPPLPTPSFFSSRPLFSVSLYFPCAWLAPTLLPGSSWEPDFCGIEIWRVGRVARGREAWRRRHSKGWWRGGEFGNWSVANATLFFTLKGNFRLQRPSLSTIQTTGSFLRVNSPPCSSAKHGLRVYGRWSLPVPLAISG